MSKACIHDDDPSVKMVYVEKNDELWLKCPKCGEEVYLRKLREDEITKAELSGIEISEVDKLILRLKESPYKHSMETIEVVWRHALIIIEALRDGINNLTYECDVCGQEFTNDDGVICQKCNTDDEREKQLQILEQRLQEQIAIESLHYDEIRNILEVGIDVSIPVALRQLMERANKLEADLKHDHDDAQEKNGRND